jgi:sigma-E factor negative regulatory protein RseC
MEEIGIVTKLEGPKAFVVVQKQSACDSCAAGGHCKAGEGGVAIEAVNDANAKAGDTVKVVFKTVTYLKGTLLLWGVPAVALVLGAVLGKEYLRGFFPAADPDLLSAAGGFGLLGISLVVVRLITQRIEHRKEYIPVIEQVIETRR